LYIQLPEAIDPQARNDPGNSFFTLISFGKTAAFAYPAALTLALVGAPPLSGAA
jgi:hypothetical protein